MLLSIGQAWSQGNFWDKAYIVFGIITCVTALIFALIHLSCNTKKKLKFVIDAQRNGNSTVGKLTCLLLHGSGKPQYFEAEYMYFVDNKQYFVTYKMAYEVPKDQQTDKMNADMVLLGLKDALILFYDKKNPKKVMCKQEIFVSDDGFMRIATLNKNTYRNIEKNWTEPIDLVIYD